jgi:hypothetical protein
MNYFSKHKANKIKRKNFFYYLGASALGIYAVFKHPFSILQSKLSKEIQPKVNFKIKVNPLAVKRNMKGQNG